MCSKRGNPLDFIYGPNQLPFPLEVCSQENSILGHVTCFEHWDNSKFDASRDLKPCLHIFPSFLFL